MCSRLLCLQQPLCLQVASGVCAAHSTAAHLLLLRLSGLQQRKNIEGSLFLIKRRTSPRFQMLVLNKLSTGGEAVEGASWSWLQSSGIGSHALMSAVDSMLHWWLTD